MSELNLAMVYTIITPENKMLLEAARKRGIELTKVDEAELSLCLTEPLRAEYDAVLQRSSAFLRSLYLTRIFEANGVPVVNGYDSQRICGDKLICSLLMAKAGVPTPRTFAAFTPKAAMAAIGELGYPVVSKPTMGSWARMVSRINDKDAAEALFETREEIGSFYHKVYYLQEYVNKPGRDIRAFVVGERVIAAIYRVAGEGAWITNTARGGKAVNCPVTAELEEVCLKATAIAGDGVYGVDLMERDGGLLVHEINHTTEFRNSIAATGIDIPGEIIDYTIRRAKR